MNEKEFYEELGRMAGPPPYLYGKICRRLQRRTTVMRAVFALAATLILAVGTSGVLYLHHEAGQALSPEVSEELQTIHGYLAGEDIEQASLSYAIEDGEGK
jgi:hypothetical protein